MAPGAGTAPTEMAVFAALSLTGWSLLPPGDGWRRPWQAAGVVVVVLFAVWLPNQVDLLKTVDRDLSNQGIVERDLEALVDEDAFVPLTEAGCLPFSAPNHRAVPRLAFWLDIRPSEVVSVAAQDQPGQGYFLAPARDFTVNNFILDPGEPGRAVDRPPPGFTRVAANRSWLLYRRCAGVPEVPTAGPGPGG